MDRVNEAVALSIAAQIQKHSEDGLGTDEAIENILSIVEFIDHAESDEDLDEVPSSWAQIAAIALYMARETNQPF